MTAAKPILSLEWHITDRCNYRCSYCIEGQYDPSRPNEGHMPDEWIERILDLAGSLPRTCQIKFAHGEPTTHPRFVDTCGRLVSLGHRIALTTNLSMSEKRQTEFIDCCGERLDFVTASFHPEQVSTERFRQRALAFMAKKNPNTGFVVTMVMLPEQFPHLQALASELEAEGLNVRFSLLKVASAFVRYPEEIERYLATRSIGNTETIRGKSFFGRLCHTGSLFFIIQANGDCFRCFNQPEPFNYLGSVRDGSFSRFEEARPCLSRRCTCTVAANRHMIEFDSSRNPAHILAHAWQMGNRNRRRVFLLGIKKIRRLASGKRQPKRASKVGESKGS